MEVVRESEGDVLHVRVSGRLDNHWAEPFDEAIEEMIREGRHHLRLDLSGVTYLSSAGVGALMNAYRETKNLHGSFLITAASDRVRTILELVSLDAILFGLEKSEPAASVAGPGQTQSENAAFEVHPLDAPRSESRWLGEPARLRQSAYTSADTSAIAVRGNTFALGVGALGQSYDECRSLFGEFVAAAGTAAFMPTDGTTTPDYMTLSGELVPEVQALYAIVFEGSPAQLLRFEARTVGVGVPLSEIVAACASVAGADEFGMVMAAEVGGLVCTGLRRSPALDDPAQFDFPSVRDWLSFTPEHEFARSSALVVGVLSASPSEAMRPFLRPVSDPFHGHLHAAVTAFRSLPRGRVEIGQVLSETFQPRSVVSVVHLIRDSRPIEGAGESEFQRGACWVFPLSRNGVAS